MNILHMNEIELFFEPRTQILPKLSPVKGEPEMTEFESAFLCGLLKKYKPHNIVEVGIAGGATTAIILQCMVLLKVENFVLHSIDYSEKFYRDPNYKSGFLADEAKNILDNNVKFNHYVNLGDVACSFVDNNSDQEEIDFLILDTMHILPGEILDFVTLLPRLKRNAVVVLHDIARNLYQKKAADSFATGALFSSVVAEKFINYDNLRGGYPNIGAFVCNEDTREHIMNCFEILLLTWSYIPEERQAEKYSAIIAKYYPKEFWKYFRHLSY